MESLFTPYVKLLWERARAGAHQAGFNVLTTEHFILTLLQEDNQATRLLRSLDVQVESIVDALQKQVARLNPSEKQQDFRGMSRHLDKIFKISYLEAKILRSSDITELHLLLSTLRDEDNLVTQLMAEFDVNYENVKEKVEANLPGEPEPLFKERKDKTAFTPEQRKYILKTMLTDLSQKLNADDLSEGEKIRITQFMAKVSYHFDDHG